MFRLLFFVVLFACFSGWLTKQAAIRHHGNPRLWFWIGFFTIGIAGLIYVWVKQNRPNLFKKAFGRGSKH